MLKEINEACLDGFLVHPVAVLIFSSPWCTSCKKLATSLEGLCRRLESRVAFGMCDISANPSNPSKMQVFSVPALIVFKEGREVRRLQGQASEAEISKALEVYL